MFPQLPEEMERKIWQSFWSMYILKEVKNQKPVWINPSNALLFNSSDLGAIQHGYSDMEKTIFYNSFTWNRMRYCAYVNCFENICYNCIHDGFPCENATFYGVLNPKLVNWWDLSYYNNVTNNYEFEDIDIGAEFI